MSLTKGSTITIDGRKFVVVEISGATAVAHDSDRPDAVTTRVTFAVADVKPAEKDGPPMHLAGRLHTHKPVEEVSATAADAATTTKSEE